MPLRPRMRGVVDEHVEAAEFALGALDGGRPGILGGDVERTKHARPPEAAISRADLLADSARTSPRRRMRPRRRTSAPPPRPDRGQRPRSARPCRRGVPSSSAALPLASPAPGTSEGTASAAPPARRRRAAPPALVRLGVVGGVTELADARHSSVRGEAREGRVDAALLGQAGGDPDVLRDQPEREGGGVLPGTTCSLKTTSELKLRAVEALKTSIIVAGVGRSAGRSRAPPR